MTMALDRSVAFDLLLMAFGCVMALLSMLAILALLLLTYVSIIEGISVVSALLILLMMGMAVWNLARSIKLVNFPEGRQAAFILARSFIAIVAPVLSVAILWAWGV